MDNDFTENDLYNDLMRVIFKLDDVLSHNSMSDIENALLNDVKDIIVGIITDIELRAD